MSIAGGDSSLIIHLIDSLGMGGAEVLLKNTVNLLPEYEHLVIYLNKPETLKNEFTGDVEFICLNYAGWHNLFKTVGNLRRVLKSKDPTIVHSHLFVSTVIARLATPKRIPLFTTLHSIFSIDAFQKNRKSLWIERLTLKKRHSLIAVSKFVLNDYLEYISFKGNQFVLYNFLPNDCFQLQNHRAPSEELRCIAVGNLKEAKNYDYLLQIFSYLKNTRISLDIYGEGTIKDELQKKIEDSHLPVRLLGKASNVTELFKHYNLFVQASLHEGFGISVIEAIAAKLPVLISDIPVFREVTSGHAHFFSLNNADEASRIFMHLFVNAVDRRKHVEPAFDYCREQYSSGNYKKKLLSIYNSCLTKDAKLSS